ncbi:MAG: HD-GYP domain-containing protein [Deltaproteobacteria bacterium]|nr:HD-GYP domain-containing protein [Deltaproteobacteria bacterium]
MHAETLILSSFVGCLALSLILFGIYSKRLRKQVKKQGFQLNTIEQLYNEVQRASRTIDKNVIGSIEALVQALEARDSYTKGHSERVNKYSMAIGKRLKLSDHELEILHDASLLHDIGKIGVYDRILLKPANLSEEEFALMKSHPDLAAGILSSLSFLEEHIPLIQHHHERQDGSGYPLGLKGDEIPLGARIIQVADTWDAMTSDRPYRRRMPTDVAVKELVKAAGTQLDQNCVQAFIDWLKETGRLIIHPQKDKSPTEPAFI